MTPAARIAAAISILDGVQDGGAAEKELTGWARRNRYAGSGDRAAIRDHVFDALRCRNSFASLGGSTGGRGLMLGMLRAQGTDPATVFNGEGYAPSPLTPGEDDLLVAGAPSDLPPDLPDWLMAQWRDSLGDQADDVAAALRHRAPVFLRANLQRITRDDAAQMLAQDDIDTTPHPLSPSALQVLTHPRRVQASAAYRDGLVELQDAASQAISDMVPVANGARVLDYCAGGGGKTLALAGRAAANFFAHDAEPRRMKDLSARAARANAAVSVLQSGQIDAAAPFDTVLCDVPCSGSGAWRRSPEGKWALTADRLAELQAIQAEILEGCQSLVAPGGHLVYVTCSVLNGENGDQISGFLTRHPNWHETARRQLTPLDGGDGFFLALLQAD